MATSESDDFESADEEMNCNISSKNIQTQLWSSPTTIDSESDDDTEFVPRTPYKNVVYSEKYSLKRDLMTYEKTTDKDTPKKSKDDSIKNMRGHEKEDQPMNNIEKADNDFKITSLQTKVFPEIDSTTMNSKVTEDDGKNSLGVNDTSNSTLQTNNYIANESNTVTNIYKENVSTNESEVTLNKFLIQDELSEVDMPDEMKSDKKFKEVFKPEGWEGLGSEIELPEELTEEKLQPILKKLSLMGQETQNSSKGWGWNNWGVSSLINTATAGVSTLTGHVSHGLTFLEESIAATEESKPNEVDDKESIENKISHNKTEEQSEQYSSFGFGNLISSVSSITKLVESTGSKVMSGGLDTLEAIGKKTMEVLQEGDPGLKRKRAIFINEAEKPILSQVLREAKEKAETIERSMEEKQKMRKIHFESLFDDYQGLVHLEALEMLSKQSDIKIQQYLTGLSITELTSAQETLKDVKELCDIDENDEKEGEINDLKFKLQEICNDLGVNITYEKLHNVCKVSEAYLASTESHTEQDILEQFISTLAQFTAFSVERFHKTAELFLIKEHRSTVNEADALVQITHALSNQIRILANAYCNALHACSKRTSNTIKKNTTTIFTEASNASTYIQDAFKLLIPIIQVGAI